MKHRPLLLVVLDGWGHRESPEYNAIAREADYFHGLLERYPHTLLSASGKEVGLPLGLMGNSEVGHMNLGAGRVVYQDISRIDKSIEDGDFFENAAFTKVIDDARASGKKLHLVGLVSDGGVHSSDHHLRNLLKLAARRGLAAEQVIVHALLDGRDTPPRSGAGYLDVLEKDIAAAGVGRIATIIGRYWAMDRDKRWDRTKRAFDLFVLGKGETYESARAAIEHSYASDTGDEFVEPSIVGAPALMEEGDGVLCFNFRSDRMRQICLALGFPNFTEFERARTPTLAIVTMTQYRADFPFPIGYPPNRLNGIFTEIISQHGLTQKRVAETEKYAHVTFFFSGGNEEEVPGESRILIPSPKVATYDLQPSMSAPTVTDAILSELRKDETDVYIINYANADMVGHTGIFDAACLAVKTIDECLAKIVPEVTRRGGLIAITADHGNSEMLWDEKHDQPHTAHTTNPVPIVLCADDLVGQKLRAMGTLADVTPTLLELCGLEKSPEMDGTSLLD